MKKSIACCLLPAFAAALLSCPTFAAAAPPEVEAPSALLMEAAGGTVLYEKNAHEPLNPASVTKVMTLLLTMEAIESGNLSLDSVLSCSEHAASMGGSQIYLEPGEQMTLHELLKSIAVASANDACVMVGEHIAGSESGFVERMNARAAELGMTDTHFVNCTGLDAPGHVTSAYDIALMSRELMKHDLIYDYTTIWMDNVRNGEFGLTNTNKLVRFYDGATGLKTGFTASAGYCISATARRDDMDLIAVIMKAQTSPKRNADASNLLNFGFANFAVLRQDPALTHPEVSVRLGVEDSVATELAGGDCVVIDKSAVSRVETNFSVVEEVEAPVEKGQTLGRYTVTLDGEVLYERPVVAAASVERLTVGRIYADLLSRLFMHHD